MFLRIFLFLFFSPLFLFAKEIYFSEIMFDPKGTDTNHEWVEIKNDNNFPVNLEKYKFCDSGSCHYLYEVDGGGYKIPANSFGILTKNPEQFKSDYLNFNSFILKTSFSLKNTDGELLELKNKDGVVVNEIRYNPEVGGKDGDTLSLFGEFWKNSEPTAGAENKEKEVENNDNSSSSNQSDKDEVKRSHSYVEYSDIIDGKKRIRVKIDEIPTLIAGAEYEFSGRVFNLDGLEIDSGAEFFWSFGDGGKSQRYIPTHTYLSPGKYYLNLIVKEGHFTGNDRVLINVIENNLKISSADQFKNWIELENNSSFDLNIGGWVLSTDGEEFKIPKNTFILAKSKIKFLNKITNLDVVENKKVFLKYPNGLKADIFDWKIEEKNNNDDEKIEKKDEEKKEILNKKVQRKKAVKIKTFVNNFFEKRNGFFEKRSDKVLEKEGNLKIDFSKFGDYKKRNFDVKDGGDEVVVKNLELKDYGYFLEKNLFLVVFWLFTTFVLVLTYWLNLKENENILDDDVKKEAMEYDIFEE